MSKSSSVTALKAKLKAAKKAASVAPVIPVLPPEEGSAAPSEDRRRLLELTRQRNALQEEVTRLNVQASLKVTHRDANGRRLYDVSAPSGEPDSYERDDKYDKAFEQMSVLEQTLVNGSRMGLHDFWSRHALLAYLFLVHLFALFYVVHDLNPDIVSEVDYALEDHHVGLSMH